MVENEAERIPHWDMSNIFPGLETPEFVGAAETLRAKIESFEKFIEVNGIGEDAEPPANPSDLANLMVEFINHTNECALLEETIDAYLFSFVSTDSFNTLAKKLSSEHEIVAVRLTRALITFQSWLRSVVNDPSEIETMAETSPALEAHKFFLQDAFRQSQYRMSLPEETLASELSLSGGSAWTKLQGTITSQLSVPFERDGELEELPMAALQNVRRYDSDETMRKRAFEAEIAAWESVDESLAACMNGVKGEVNTLNNRRGRDDSLHASLDQSRMDRASLDAMLSSIEAYFPKFREYFKAKAGVLGKQKLAWWDLFVPVGHVERSFAYSEARTFIVENFRGFSDRLANFTDQVFKHNWIDAEPRKGKRGGAFCMGIAEHEESRILSNFDGSLDQVSTLAHELGHAFHNACHEGLTPIQRMTPMTLAETASIFNETLINNAMLGDSDSDDEELAILENFLLNASQVTVDIYSRYKFEMEVFERRQTGELSAEDFNEIMLRCQRESYGDGLDERFQHPYMWAWKPHYYSTNRSYYNYPYAFGLLFGLGLYAVYGQRGDAFISDYENLLRSTGQGDAAELAERFGIDLRSGEFWQGSLDYIAARIDRFVEIAAARK